MEEKLLYQFIMNYKAYRRIMISTRLTVTLILMGAMLSILVVSVALGIIFALIVAFLGALWIIISVQKEQSYMVFDTRFVIKDRAKRVSVPLENIVSVSYKRAFYEKDLATGTVTIRAKRPDGKLKKYRFYHVFDARECVEFLKNAADKNASGVEEENVGNNDKG